jgi:hypothetical protein
MSAMKPSRCALLAAAAFVSAACSGAEPLGPPTFPADALVTTMSASGALRIEVRTSPQPPSRGTNSVELTVTAASDGKPRDDLSVDVTPWMPAMNHGSSAIPTVTPQGGGRYLLPEVYLFMPGHWELRTSFSGAMTDHAAPAVDIP